MAKVKVYVSNQGEIFEGTQAELMREKGITRKASFKQASGAPDADGDRWKEEGEEFRKDKLFLGPRIEKGLAGRKCFEAPSDTAMWYVWARKEVLKDISDDDRAEIEANIKQIEGTYTIIATHFGTDFE